MATKTVPPTPRSQGPFPQRFARQPRSTSRGPNPGELLPFKQPLGDAVMNLGDFFPAKSIQDIQKTGSISFHAVGDSGVGTSNEQAVADAMSRDINQTHPELGPAFMLHLGDILYGNDKLAGYANRFYRPNENYHNLIFAIPGNHDGEVRSDQDHFSLEAYLENFCQLPGKQPPLGVSFGRIMPTQPGAYWRLTCPFVDIIGLYSCTGENFGAIAHSEIGQQQKTWLGTALKDIAKERSGGHKQALLIAVHHPPYASGLKEAGFGHPGNPEMLQDIDDCCTQANVFPDAVLSAHAHNYQRYMRTQTQKGGDRTVPYIVCGTGGIGTQPVPTPIGASVGGVRYSNGIESLGFMTVTVSAKELTLVFTQAIQTHRGVFESITIDLATGRQL